MHLSKMQHSTSARLNGCFTEPRKQYQIFLVQVNVIVHYCWLDEDICFVPVYIYRIAIDDSPLH